MNLKHWGTGLRAIFAILVSLPVAALGVLAWFGINTVTDLVEVTKKAIVELPADKGIEVANMLAHVHDRSEALMVIVPAACLGVMVAVHVALCVKFFAWLTASSLNLLNTAQAVQQLGDRFAQTTESLTLGSSQSKAALEQSIGSLESLSSTLHRTAIDVSEADKSSRQAAEDAIRSEVELATVVNSLTELASQSRRLEEIINVIDSIAFQTNILAVNAAVEAARAGEQGRGFAIVAEAVRNLAQTSATSAKNITLLIRESGEVSKKAIENVRSGAANMNSAVSQARRSQNLIHRIANSTTELTEALARISQNLSHLESTTQITHASAQQSGNTQQEFSEKIASLESAAKSWSEFIVHPAAFEASAENKNETTEQKTTVVAASDARVSERTIVSRNVLPAHVHGSHTSPGESAGKLSRMNISPQTFPKKPTSSAKTRARELIPFEGETESERSTDVKLGNTSGF